MDLLSALTPAGRVAVVDGAVLLPGFARDGAGVLHRDIQAIAARAPFRRMVTPGGFTMSVAMTNAGAAGWVTDRSGYRYTGTDPRNGEPWPDLSAAMAILAGDAARAAGFVGFAPDACLINRYEAGARMSLHQDRNERDMTQPIVSVSLGLPAIFLFGGMKRTDPTRKIRLESGDVVVWGGPARLAFHGVQALADGEDRLFGRFRYNLTFRVALGQISKKTVSPSP